MDGQMSYTSHDPMIARAAAKKKAASPLRRLFVLEDVPGKRLRVGSPEDDDLMGRPRRAPTEPRAHWGGKGTSAVTVPSGVACHVLFDATGVEVTLEPVARRRPATVRVPAAAITRLRLRASSELGCGLDLELSVDTGDAEPGVQARFRVAGLDLYREAQELALRMGRAVGLSNYVVLDEEREVVLVRENAPVEVRLARGTDKVTVLDAVPETVDWLDTTRRLRRVSEQTQRFHTTCASGRPYTVQQWEPGWLVHLADAWSSSHAPGWSRSRRSAVVALVGLSLLIGVLGLSWTHLAPSGDHRGVLEASASPLLAWGALALAGMGAGGWWLVARRQRALHPRHELVFDWAAASLLFRHEERVVREVGFDEITEVEATLYRGATRRVSLQLPDRVVVLAEWKHADKQNTCAARSMAVELARALDVPLRTDA